MATKQYVYRSKWADLPIPNVVISDFIAEKLDDADHGHGDKLAFIDASDSSRSYTFKQFKQQAIAVAKGLQAQGLKQNDVVLIYSPNTIDYPSILFGITLAGGIATLANPTYTLSELKHQLKDSTAKYAFTVGPMAGLALEACKDVGIDASKLYVLGAKPEGTTSFADLVKPTSHTFVKPTQRADDVAVIPYSSGTTGLPKGVMLTHKNLIANILQVKTINGTSVTSADTFVGVLPFFHIYGLVVVLFTGMYNGNTTTVISKFDLPAFLETVQKNKITTMHLVPPIILGLAKHPLVLKYNFSSVKTIMSGAAPLGAELCKEFNQRFPKVNLRQGYGMTELSPVSHFQTADDVVFGSIGVLCCNQEAMIVDPETLQSLPTGQSGELWIKGPNVMKGYWKRKEATDAMLVDGGWLRTGDIAMVDKNGHYYIVDRLKELIKYKGFQVAPAELEECILTHPEVADCAVLGVPDLGAGELPKAYVVVKDKNKPNPDIAAFVASKLAPHKQLRGGVRFVDAIPKSASGKILRRVLKDEDAKLTKAKL